MKRALAACLLLAACASTSTSTSTSTPASTAPPDPMALVDRAAPAGMHAFLERFLGDWTMTSEVPAGPDGPPMDVSSKESVHAVGHRWIVSDLETEIGGMRLHAMFTLGYDDERDRFVGSWVDSMTAHMWIYDGRLDESGNVLTLEAEGPDFQDPSVTRTYRDVTEFLDDDHRELRSFVFMDDEWIQYMTARAERVR